MEKSWNEKKSEFGGRQKGRFSLQLKIFVFSVINVFLNDYLFNTYTFSQLSLYIKFIEVLIDFPIFFSK